MARTRTSMELANFLDFCENYSTECYDIDQLRRAADAFDASEEMLEELQGMVNECGKEHIQILLDRCMA